MGKKNRRNNNKTKYKGGNKHTENSNNKSNDNKPKNNRSNNFNKCKKISTTGRSQKLLQLLHQGTSPPKKGKRQQQYWRAVVVRERNVFGRATLKPNEVGSIKQPTKVEIRSEDWDMLQTRQYTWTKLEKFVAHQGCVQMGPFYLTSRPTTTMTTETATVLDEDMASHVFDFDSTLSLYISQHQAKKDPATGGLFQGLMNFYAASKVGKKDCSTARSSALLVSSLMPWCQLKTKLDTIHLTFQDQINSDMLTWMLHNFTQVKFFECSLADRGVALFQTLSSDQSSLTMERLILDYTDVDFSLLVQALQISPTTSMIQTLKVCSNQDNVPWGELIGATYHCNSLINVSFGGDEANCTQDEWLAWMIALIENHNLIVVSFALTSMIAPSRDLTLERSKQICSALQTNITLKKLHVDGTEIRNRYWRNHIYVKRLGRNKLVARLAKVAHVMIKSKSKIPYLLKQIKRTAPTDSYQSVIFLLVLEYAKRLGP